MRLRVSRRRQHDGAAFAEADPGKSRLGAKAPENDFVAVLDEAAVFAARQRDRLAAACSELEEASAARFLRTGDGVARLRGSLVGKIA
jgi:hypothetical protein